MNFDKIIKDNGLTEITSIELISVMSTILDMLKDRIDEYDSSADEFEVDMDDMDSDELCDLATAVMMVISERVGEDEDDELDYNDDDDDDDDDENFSELDESYITEAGKSKIVAELFSDGKKIVANATKADLDKALQKVPKYLQASEEYEAAVKYARGRKGLSPDKLEKIKNSKLGEWLLGYSNKQLQKGSFKPAGGSSKITAGSARASASAKASVRGSGTAKASAEATASSNNVGRTRGKPKTQKPKTETPKTETPQNTGKDGINSNAGSTASTGDVNVTTGPNQVTTGSTNVTTGSTNVTTGTTNVSTPVTVTVVNGMDPQKLAGSVDPKQLSEFGVKLDELKADVDKLRQVLPECAAISAKYGEKAAKKFALWKYLLAIGIPAATLGGGALYVKKMIDTSEMEIERELNGINDGDFVGDQVNLPRNRDSLNHDKNYNSEKNGDHNVSQSNSEYGNGEMFIDPSIVNVQDNGILYDNNIDNFNHNSSKQKPKRIKYAGLGGLFNDIGSFVDDTGTNIGSGIGKTIGGIGK